MGVLPCTVFAPRSGALAPPPGVCSTLGAQLSARGSPSFPSGIGQHPHFACSPFLAASQAEPALHPACPRLSDPAGLLPEYTCWSRCRVAARLSSAVAPWAAASVPSPSAPWFLCSTCLSQHLALSRLHFHCARRCLTLLANPPAARGREWAILSPLVPSRWCLAQHSSDGGGRCPPGCRGQLAPAP